MVASVREEQCSKAQGPMLVNGDGMVIEVREVQE